MATTVRVAGAEALRIEIQVQTVETACCGRPTVAVATDAAQGTCIPMAVARGGGGISDEAGGAGRTQRKKGNR